MKTQPTYNDAHTSHRPEPVVPDAKPTILDTIVDWVGKTPESEPFNGSSVFGYNGRRKCASCPTAIVPGDEVQRGLDGQLEHTHCPDELTIPAQGVCDTCWTTRAVNGSCGCA